MNIIVLTPFALVCLLVPKVVLVSGDSVDKELEVTISVDYNPPSTFHRKSTDDYRAASAVTLTCLTNVGTNEGLLYEWSSTCTGACFVRGRTTKSVSTHYLNSYDSGVHTCVVYDGVGCSGNASITMNVVGAGIYVHDGHQVLPNNSIIVAGASGRIGEFRCLSGSKRSNVGHFINMAGVDTTYSSDDPFYVTRGTSHRPGMLHVRSFSLLGPEDEGVYTCRIPDENDELVSVNVGLYVHDFLKSPVIESLEANLEGQRVICTTSQSPATNIIWTCNNIIITHNSSQYQFSQILLDRRNSIYKNVLTMEGSFEAAVGDYSCTVTNTMGNATAEIKIDALEITGNDKPIIVGLSGAIVCTTKLNVSLMEWYLVGVDDAVEKARDTDTLLLLVEPQTAGLDGAMFTCKATTVTGNEFEESVTISVKELDHTVSIEGQDNPLLAGETHTITCVVVTDITPTVRWMGPDGNPVVEGEGITLGEAIIKGGTTTRLTLSFSPLHTSHGGSYSCLSVVDVPSSVRRATRNIIVKIPPPLTSIIHTPNDTQLFTTSQLQLTCLVEVDPAVDTAVTVSNSWSGPSGEISSDSRITVSGVLEEDQKFQSNLSFSSMRSSDSGIYTCSSTVQPLVPSLIIESSDSTSSNTRVDAALKVTIEISYTPPDQYPDYEPPNYRAASSVTLRCVAEEASGSVSYRWTSTCSSCFASSSTSSSISENILRSRDIGVHTCTATDDSGNTGSASREMNIVGAGVYVTRSANSGGSQNAQPNNTFFNAYDGYRYNDYTRFSIYCCSNSTSYRTGYIKSYSSTYSSNYWYYRVSQQSSGSYIGCVQFYLYYGSSSYFYLSSYSSYYGLFTCTIQDNNGVNQHVNFGLYPQSFNTRPDTYSFSHISTRDSSLTLLCKSRYAPPTSITWEKDGEPLDIDWNTIRMRQGITNYYYSNSYYDNVLLIDKQPDDVTGQYTCTVGNKFGRDTSNTVTIQGMQLVANDNLTVSNSTTFECSSDLDVLRIQWFRDGRLVESTTDDDTEITLDIISTDDNDANYTCRVTSPYGIQERSVVLEVKVPDEWGTVDISNSTNEDAVHQTDYALICTVNVIDGMTLTPDFEWFYPNGSMITSDGSIDVGGPQKDGNITTSTLTFNPVLSEHGGIYTCKVSVNVPWMREQPQSHSASVNMAVTTQAMFQLKIEPVKYCIEWNFEEVTAFDEWVRWNIEKAIRQRCDCDFKSSAIYSGEFSCRKYKTSVIYRAIINGTSDLHTADELMDFIEDWRTNEGTLLYNRIRLNIVNEETCSFRIQSFNDEECHGGATTPEPLPSKMRPTMLSPDSCYTFHECETHTLQRPDVDLDQGKQGSGE